MRRCDSEGTSRVHSRRWCDDRAIELQHLRSQSYNRCPQPPQPRTKQSELQQLHCTANINAFLCIFGPTSTLREFVMCFDVRNPNCILVRLSLVHSAISRHYKEAQPNNTLGNRIESNRRTYFRHQRYQLSINKWRRQSVHFRKNRCCMHGWTIVDSVFHKSNVRSIRQFPTVYAQLVCRSFDTF